MSLTVWQKDTAFVIERYASNAHAAGLGPVWEHVIGMDESATRTLLLGIVGALSTFLAETGYCPPT